MVRRRRPAAPRWRPATPTAARLSSPNSSEVVHIAHVARAAQLALDEVVERIHVAVGPELAGQVADGQAARTVDGKEIVAGEVDHVVLFAEHADAALQNPVAEPEHPFVFDLARQDVAQDGVIDAGEELADVALQARSDSVAPAPGRGPAPDACPCPRDWRRSRR